MISKKQVIQTVNDLPENFTSEELIQKIILLQKIENGIKDSMSKQLVTHDEAKKQLSKWLK